jgi:hypothetical protein
MQRFRVKFLKNISDATGHEHKMCQREFDVDAESEAAAVEQAKALFSPAEQSGEWSLRADAIEVEPI